MRFLKSCFIIAVLLATPVGAADYNAGFKAYQSGDYQTAFKKWQPLAEQGDEYAQNNLGVMYARGQGGLQDYVTAHMWGNISAANGHKPELRDLIAGWMTSDQLAEALRRARVCMASDYKNCD